MMWYTYDMIQIIKLMYHIKLIPKESLRTQPENT